MIEPTESESRETLDRFVDVLQSLVDRAHTDPDWPRFRAPLHPRPTPRRRPRRPQTQRRLQTPFRRRLIGCVRFRVIWLTNFAIGFLSIIRRDLAFPGLIHPRELRFYIRRLC